jgi:hypothetical protein
MVEKNNDYNAKKLAESKIRIKGNPELKSDLVSRSGFLGREYKRWAEGINRTLDNKFVRDSEKTVIFSQGGGEHHYHVDYAAVHNMKDIIDPGRVLINITHKKVFIFGGSHSLALHPDEEERENTVKLFSQVFDDFEVIGCKEWDIDKTMKE